MDTLFYISGMLIGVAIGYGLCRSRPTKWRTVLPPEDVDRGPNADDSYRAVWVGGHDHWFTREEVIDANERALKYRR